MVPEGYSTHNGSEAGDRRGDEEERWGGGGGGEGEGWKWGGGG